MSSRGGVVVSTRVFSGLRMVSGYRKGTKKLSIFVSNEKEGGHSRWYSKKLFLTYYQKIFRHER